MGYIQSNKEAWEEAFEASNNHFGKEDVEKIKNTKFACLNKDLVSEIQKYDFKGKRILQLCCNNGRETMSIVKGTEAEFGVGIDIAENIVAQANEHAAKLEINCEFTARNVLEIKEEWQEQFDAVFVIKGAICWFEDLKAFFSVAERYLKPDGLLFVYEIHPCTNMLAVKGEDIFDEMQPTKIAWSYFKDEPFKDDFGIAYMNGGQYESKVFTSFSYKMSDVISGICKNDMQIMNFTEYDYDIGGEFRYLDGQGFPLSFMVVAQKKQA